MKNRITTSCFRFLPLCSLVAAVCTFVVPAGAQQPASRIRSEIAGTELVPLKNSLHPLAQARFEAGRMASDTQLKGITLTFQRSATQEAALQSLIVAQQNPQSPLYHKWLNPDQFAARFGMSDADLQKTEGWLEQQGFSVDRVARSKNAIYFSGNVRQVEQAFSTEMHYFKVNGEQHFAPSTQLSVPSALASSVLGITNLDSFRPKSHMVAKKNVRPRGSFTGAGNSSVLFGPADIATAYDITPLYNASVTGSGQSITVVGQSAIDTSDIEAFETAAGLPTKDPNQYLVPGSGDPTVQADGDEFESDVDIEWSGAIAKGASINFVYSGGDTNYSAFDAINYAVDNQIGTIISSSYGLCEADLNGYSLESSLEQGTAQGQTIMAAAGDQGSTDCNAYQGPGSGTLTAADTALAVDYPASSQYVTGLGGTEIDQSNANYSTPGGGYWQSNSGSTDLVNSVLKYIPEVVWNDDDSQYGLSASGGGASSLFTKPSWQTGVPGIPSDGQRDVPDLALYGSPNFPGYLVCSSDSSQWTSGQVSSCSTGFEDTTTGFLTAAGGTSFDAPIFSGMLALINQKQGYGTGQGLINKTLYTLAANSGTYGSAFHDITKGNNDCSAGSTWCGTQTSGFSAGAGYDQVSGLGSVDLNNLATAWPANTSTTSLTPTTTTIAASATTVNVGTNDTFNIAVTAASGTPGGNISITVDTNTAVSEALAANGTYVYTTSFSTTGSHVIFVSYPSGSTYEGSTASITVTATAVSSGKGTISIGATPSSLSVAQGSSGSETLTITPASGYTGTVDLNFDTSNDNALQNLCYEFTNTNSSGTGTVAIAGTTAVTTQLTLDANAADCNSTAGASHPVGSHQWRRFSTGKTTAAKNTQKSPWPLSVAFAGLLLVGFMGRSSRKLRGLAALLLLAIVGLAVTACGGVVTTSISNPPVGSYTITVTGQDSATSSITATKTFTLVITGPS